MDKRAGSVKLTYEMSADAAERVLAAIRSGALADLGVTSGRVLEAERSSPQPITSSPGEASAERAQGLPVTIQDPTTTGVSEASTDSKRTGSTLFNVIKRPSEENWERFVFRYGPSIEKWVRLMGVQPADVENATQQTFLRLHSVLPKFQHNQSKAGFRKYLKTVSTNIAKDVLRKLPINTGGMDLEVWFSEQSLNEKWKRSEIDDLAERETLEVAMCKVERVTKPEHFAAFKMLLRGHSVKEVVDATRLSTSNIHQIKSRLTKNLRHQIKVLDGESEEEAT